MNTDRAEQISVAALAWLGAQEALLPVFLGASGASVDDLRAQLTAPHGPDHAFLESVLDFIMMQDDTVIACCHAQAITPDQLAMAHSTLSGRARMHWT